MSMVFCRGCGKKIHKTAPACPDCGEPQAASTPSSSDTVRSIEKVASGQKLIIYAILVQFLAVGIQAVFGDIAGLVGIIAVIMSYVGMFRLASGLGYSTGAKIGLVVLLLVPLVGLVTLLVLNSRATKALRAEGYKVGLLGARR